jgi:hypothetical protein
VEHKVTLEVSKAESPLQDDVFCLGCGRPVKVGEPIVRGFDTFLSRFVCFECWEWLAGEFGDWWEKE